ncbi:MAG: type I-F CRISPR-associated protein Csy1 [Deltaproteobacteria bacterium]|nr:type I-F CRISPR-associated protein Csy1 [Deltaproteobacteria bacterium]
MEPPAVERQNGFRAVLDAFLEERLQKELKNARSKEEEERSRKKFNPAIWLENAARRAPQLRASTHVLKATHPDARGINPYCRPADLKGNGFVGSCLLPEDFIPDVTGNAAALDVYAFLRLEYEGKTLLRWLEAGDADLLAALHPEAAQAASLAHAFAGLLLPVSSPASHTFAKQVYWLAGEDPVDNTHFHLLGPLYASSLAQAAYQAIDKDRFGEEAKSVRAARKTKVWHERELREYPGLAVQKLGGTKPQNISQLNSERHGKNYLLPSLPPVWASRALRPPYGADFFTVFGRRGGPSGMVRDLQDFLKSNPPPDRDTRNKRDAMLTRLIDELFVYVGGLRGLAPGWSRDARCRLHPAEKRWLDPGALPEEPSEDPSGETEYGGLPPVIVKRFADWLNHALGKELPLSDVEHAFWAESLEDAWKETDHGQSA